MFRILRVLLVCSLLVFVLWSVAGVVQSYADKTSQADAKVDEENAIVLTAATLVTSESHRSALDAAFIGVEFPILLPINPPYLFQPTRDEEPPPVIDPPAMETSRDQEEESEASQPDKEDADEPAEETSADEEAVERLPDVAPPAEPEPKPELSQAMAALRDQVRRTLALFQRQPLSIRENTATEVMHYCLAFGCRTEVYRSGSSRNAQKVNGITCLCWNYPCAGYVPLGLSEGRIAARIGYGLQEEPSQLLAVLALSGVPATYPMRVGEDHVRTVADLVEAEKLSCRSGTDLSLKLIALTFYLDDDPTWQNSLAEDWSLTRIVEEELAQPILDAPVGGTQRLLGLGYAVSQREKREQPMEGAYGRAKKFIDEYHDYAFKVQNSDGSWGPRYLAAKGTSREWTTQLRSTGHVLQWLALSLPEDQLEDPQMVRSVQYLNKLLAQRTRNALRSMKTQDIGSVAHALHALQAYDSRFFTPRTAKKPTPEVTRKSPLRASAKKP